MIGLFLTGGGARGAYQAGVLHGIADLKKELGLSDDPFSWFAGNSAGAINAGFCAASTNNFIESAQKLSQLWNSLTPNQVYRTDPLSLSRIGLNWLKDVSTGTMTKKKSAHQLLDTTPLLKLLTDNLDFDQIEKKMEQATLSGIACSAFDYNQQKVVTFYQGEMVSKPSASPKRVAQSVNFNVSHVLASCAIPILFSPVEIEGDWFGDGSVRNTAPLSTLINMGCKNILMVGVRYPGAHIEASPHFSPSIAKIFGTLLNGLFFDHLDVDIERLKHVNSIVQNFEKQSERKTYINYLLIQPSKDISEMAQETSSGHLPSIVRYLLGGLGAEADSAELTSYLLFDSHFTQKLTQLGFDDAHAQKDNIKAFLDKS